MAATLSQLEVLVVDCQATAAAPRGHLLEIGWARVGESVISPHASLIALPDGAWIPPAVMLRSADDGQRVWRELLREAFTLASFDRLRVLTTELKRLLAAGAPVTLRLGSGPALDRSRLVSALWWV